MRVILIDDEKLALIQLKSMLMEQAEVEAVETFLEPKQAIRMVNQIQPDVAFLDIHMPEITGLELAELLQKACPNLDIVFVTAYDEYALQAFELNAVDYVMKPIKRERLQATVQRLAKRREYINPVNMIHNAVFVRCLQTFNISLSDEKMGSVKWRTAKAQEVFAYLIHHRGQLVRKSVLHELLWPNFDEKKATTHLYTTIYQIRQCLKKEGLEIPILSMEDAYMIEANAVSVDADEWERNMTRLSPIDMDNLFEHQRVLDAYRGDYLGDHDYLWAENERQRLRILWLNEALQVAEYYIQQGLRMEAMSVYHRIQARQPYYEHSYHALMVLYAEIGDRSAVEEQYHKLDTLLLEELGISPQPFIVEWYEQWIQNGSYS
ncbi:response regulator [Paenibacillus sp. N3.4]|uniref:response regulator n=1 Tax=Paenibacillus sp. N3.4 TaxID=2603222 RepID=UPI00165053F2|nr:response regulator [Paenibacillus sp. N3.4]